MGEMSIADINQKGTGKSNWDVKPRIIEIEEMTERGHSDEHKSVCNKH